MPYGVYVLFFRRRQSASSESVNFSLGDRAMLETTSADLDYTLTGSINRELLSEQDNASTKALAGSILGARWGASSGRLVFFVERCNWAKLFIFWEGLIDFFRRSLNLRPDTISLSNQDKSPSSPIAITLEMDGKTVSPSREASKWIRRRRF